LVLCFSHKNLVLCFAWSFLFCTWCLCCFYILGLIFTLLQLSSFWITKKRSSLFNVVIRFNKFNTRFWFCVLHTTQHLVLCFAWSFLFCVLVHKNFCCNWKELQSRGCWQKQCFLVCFYCQTSLGVECKTRHEYLGAWMEEKKNYRKLKDGPIIVVGAPLFLLFPLSISFFSFFLFFSFFFFFFGRCNNRWQ
jgi:hypothetical protein